MRNKKLISRILIIVLTIIMLITSIPFNLLTAFADGGAGGGFGGGGGTVSVSDNPINDEDIGLRFSLVTKDASGKTKVVQNIYGKYYLDVWNNAYFKQSWYDAVNSYSRYAPLPTEENIKYWNAVTFDNTIETLISASGKGEVDMGISNHMVVGGASASTFFTEGEGGLKINGDLFYNWFMEKVGTWNGEPKSRYAFIINVLYNGKLNGINLDNTFLVVEPVLHIANPTDDGNFALKGTEYIASWYGYVEGNLIDRNLEPGCAYTLRDRFSNIANNFRVTYTEHLKQNGVRHKMFEVLGIQVPNTLYTITGHGGQSIAYGNGKAQYCRDRSDLAATYDFHYKYNGLAMQIFWLKDMTTGLPIDTYDIVSNPQPKDDPANAETPSSNNQTDGEKTIIKMYCDLYKDPTTGYYTQIVDKVQYAQKNVSDKVTITNEEPINGYKVSVWYSSNTAYKNLPKGSSMFATTNIGVTDGTVKLSSLGGKQLRVNNYTAAKGYAASGGQSYYAGLSSPHGMNGKGSKASYTSKDAKPYTTYKRLAVKGKSNYGTYNYKVNDDDKAKYIELGDSEKTLVVLYTREMSHISTSDLTVTKDNDKRKDNTGELSIVKLYGIIDPNTYKITADPSKRPVVVSGVTRNVNIKSETGYNFAEWIYLTGGAGTSITAEKMGSPYLSTYKFDGTADQAYRLDGFVDGFKNNTSLEKYFRFNNKLPAIYTITGSNGLTSSITPGRYSIGSRSGIGNRKYDSTIYFGGTGSLADGTVDGSDNNDVLYLLFLKTDQLTYASDDLVIPESYLTRYDNYKHNPMTVTGSISGNTRDEYLQAHKFKYLLPVMANGLEYKELNPLFIPHIKKPTGLYFFCLFFRKIN